MVTTKFLVNGKPMTNEEYEKLLNDAREAQRAYKSTPAFTAEQEQKKKDQQAREENYNKVLSYAKSLKLSSRQIGLIGYKMYVESKDEE